MPAQLTQLAQLSDEQFRSITGMIKSICGISLNEGKHELVQARLAKRLRELKMNGFDEYLEYVQSDTSGDELVQMLDAISTNLTRFFREPDHFEYLQSEVVATGKAQAAGGRPRLRIWSAGCSSGEEPYSIAISLSEVIGTPIRWDVKILATDLSTRVLSRAMRGTYPSRSLQDVPTAIRSRHFQAHRAGAEDEYRVAPGIREMVSFARLNLLGHWPMQGQFDAIFCRNVMIYFDKVTQEEVVGRFWQCLKPGGTLFIGHSESLTGIRHKYRYVRPTVYEKA